ncbi:MAG: protease SohB [Bdellovibrionales bacterium]
MEMELFSSTLIFGLKALIFVIAFVLAIIIPVLVIKKIKPEDSKKKLLTVENLKEKYEKNILSFNLKTLNKKKLKKYLKSLKENTKKEVAKNSSFLLSFVGDKMATQVENLREEITLILNIATPEDEVILLLESPGGSVAHYGLAASQLQRLRDRNIPLTICVDKVAGSGGYLMACVGSQILSAPFAFIGSIGVLFGLPNIHDFLKKHDINYEEITAGEHKRTLTPFGEITEEKRNKLKEQLELVHDQFKNFVLKHRKNLDLKQVATGEAWLAEEAFKKGLVDKIQCSDDYIMERLKINQVYKISLAAKQNFLEKFSKKMETQSSLIEKFFYLF